MGQCIGGMGGMGLLCYVRFRRNVVFVLWGHIVTTGPIGPLSSIATIAIHSKIY